MKLKTFVIVGWFLAFSALISALFGAMRMTFERLAIRRQEEAAKAVLKPVDKPVPIVSSPVIKPVPLPSDYAVFVLCYHDFQEKPSKWSITPERLEAHIQTLKAWGFSFLTVSEAVKLLKGRWQGNLPKRAVVITVDDGFQSAYSVLFPLLKRYGAKATLFIYTEWVGKSEGSLTWEQLREMAQSGLVEIASHTVTHAYPRNLKRKLTVEKYKRKMEWEFVQSKLELERRLGIKVEGLAYPGGFVDGTLKALAQRAGYKWAAVINPKPMTANFDRYAIPRYGVSAETTVAALKAWVTRQPILLARLKDGAKPTLSNSKTKVRKFKRAYQTRKINWR
ncbi:MAG: polysaccharide deacetylase family protein [Armatimonadetes bacterium]|nr:polysaccharide deacetylase family protein [Armatimonadota bacterium]MDW8027363.1 polysaccharide deacetylase family protein [Armatimonadota bacterium]